MLIKTLALAIFLCESYCLAYTSPTLTSHVAEDITVDGIHPNDVGMMRIAAILTPVIKKIIP